MRKWIVLAFILGFIVGGVALYFYLPTRQNPVAEKPLTPHTDEDPANNDDIIAPAPSDAQQNALDDTAPASDASQNPTPGPGQSADNPDEMPPDDAPDDGLIDMSGGDNGN